ncbi:DNA polymerase IV [Anditalea andensis]|uniref:DNA polymerase IV n=2 Tax=Anditalea andensis TaxID=1048983 RepID=A0A074KXY9_9BACT|nr:DNA polymerase IV [Anditalea andensis]
MFRTMERNVVHFDLDTFFVSVARLGNSALNGKPVIIGGNSDRGVVASCSYEARKFGVHSAMPMKLARRLCPSAVYLRGDMDSYSRYSNLVTDIIRDRVPVVEKASIDEFYLDLTGMDRFFGCRQFTAELKQTILKESGLPISYALASNKLISKVATDDAKPNGQLYIPYGNEKGYLAPLAIERIPGVGNKTSSLLRRMGVETIKVLSEIPVPMMENLLGKNGIELSRKANGQDDAPVVPYTEQKSIGKEETFNSDTIDMKFLYSELIRMTESVAFQLRNQRRLCGCLTVKLRYANFDTVTRQTMIPYTANDHVLLSKAKELFVKLYDRRMLVRLLGVRVSHMVGGFQQISLFDDTEENVRLYQAMDKIRKRYGEPAVQRAVSLNTNKS